MPGEDKKTEKKKKSFFRKLLPVLILLVSLIFMPVTVVFLVGMIPSVIAFYTDKDRNKMGGMCIIFMNLTPVIAYILVLLERGYSMPNAMMLLQEPTTLMVIYFSCAIGLALNKFIPPFISDVLKRSAKKRLGRIEQEQKRLIKSWGEDVISQK